jgi:hypothetical protein
MNKYETWFHTYWRPAIAWSYLIVCLFDFIGGPLLYTIIFQDNLDKFIQWTPLTLRGGGLYHASMLTIIGVTSWGRTQEKLKLFETSTKEETDNNKSTTG